MARILALVALLAVAALGAVAAADGDSSVFVLTDDNFKEELAKHDLALVKFYAPWCGHCKAMAQSFVDAAEELKGTALLADLDATVHDKMAKEYGVTGFPTLKFFVKGEVLKDYKGARDKDGIVAGVKKALEPVFVTMDNKEAVEAFLASTAPRVLGVAPAAVDAFKAGITSLGDDLDAAALGLVTDVSLLPAALKTGADSVAVIPQEAALDSEDTKIFPMTATADELVKAVKNALIPAFGPLTMGNARLYLDLQPALVTLFLDDKPVAESPYAEIMKAAAKELAESLPKFKFVYTVGEELKGFKNYVFGEGVEPKIPVAVYKFGDDSKYVVDQESDLTLETLKTWVGKIASGELAPPLKSEPIPETQDGPVHKVVGLSFSQVCEDTTKDVLIMQYAPWCGHCKKLHPIWEAVAEKLKGEETLVIASMDATENDSPSEYKAKGYPTIQFFPAGGAMIPYSGGRTEEDIIKFIKENAKRVSFPDVDVFTLLEFKKNIAFLSMPSE
ncbi:Protein disulfide isomerase-like 1-3 [Porphyridium purpureum]|uniref:protein disulfide-isomerase n=1 Tax=Porphyridium purpureum TaxID=35688 RepID=A0A5J4YYM8_PORPP|nr:Protein disulfide isomerase-like 1-3 [Porphyridium purpureum]|eukprot:POR8860..scf209_3